MPASSLRPRPPADVGGRGLVALAAKLAGVPAAVVERRAAVLLDGAAATAAAPAPGRSALNADGRPLQLVAVLAGSQVAVRLLADPAVDAADLRERRARMRRVLDRTAERAGLPMEPFANLLGATLPADPYDSLEPEVGECWIASCLTTGGVAAYTNGAWCEPADMRLRWLAWLQETAPANADVHELLAGARAGLVVPASAGVEMDPAGRLRRKLYFRLAEPCALTELPVAPLHTPAVADFLRLTMRRAPVRRSGLVLSVAVAPGDREIRDAKIDVCACDSCLGRDPGWWRETLPELAARYGFDHGWMPALDAGDVVPAFVGLGVRGNAAPRLNLYLRAA